MTLCIKCLDATVPAARWKLGYRTCLNCGEQAAEQQSQARKKAIAPHYSKGAYMYITQGLDLSDLGRKK